MFSPIKLLNATCACGKALSHNFDLIPVADQLYDEHLAETAAEAGREEGDGGG